YGDYVKVRRVIEGGHQTLKVPVPCILSMAPSAIPVRRPSLVGAIKAKQLQIETYTLDHIGLSPDTVGLAGSPTVVAKAVNVERNRAAVTMIDGKSLEETTTNLIRTFSSGSPSAGAKKEEGAETPVAAPETESKFPRVDFRNG